MTQKCNTVFKTLSGMAGCWRYFNTFAHHMSYVLCFVARLGSVVPTLECPLGLNLFCAAKAFAVKCWTAIVAYTYIHSGTIIVY